MPMIFTICALFSISVASASIQKPSEYPYGNPWFFDVGNITSKKGVRTKEESDRLWAKTLEKPFSMDEFVSILRDYTHCRMRPANTTHASVINLAVGRTGSGTLKQALLINDLPGHHTTYCTALHAQRAGYQAVVLTIRDPAARILSGYQRRAEGATTSKEENAAFNDEFVGKKKGVNFYLDALRDPKHPKHRIALELTYGRNRQSYMIPIAQYYGLTNPELKIRVYFLCTPTLSDDFENLGKYLNWTKPTAAREFYLTSQKRRLGSISNTKSEVAAQTVSPENARWIREVVYKADSELNIRYCGEHRKNISYHDGYSLV
jgi:hypothetical protein